MNRQRVILFALVILFGISIFWSYSAIPRFKTVSNSSDGKPVQKTKKTVAVPEIKIVSKDDGTKLNINLLNGNYSGFKGYIRNIFRPIFSEEIKFVKQKNVAVSIKPIKSKILIPPADSVPIQPETATLARFTFLGFLKKGSVKTIFLANDNEILLVKKGDKVAEKYEATNLSDQLLTLTVTDTGDEIVIPLVENQPLAAAK